MVDNRNVSLKKEKMVKQIENISYRTWIVDEFFQGFHVNLDFLYWRCIYVDGLNKQNQVLKIINKSMILSRLR